MKTPEQLGKRIQVVRERATGEGKAALTEIADVLDDFVELVRFLATGVQKNSDRLSAREELDLRKAILWGYVDPTPIEPEEGETDVKSI